MELLPFDKLIITRMNERVSAHVIGMKIELNGTITYIIEPLRKDFARHRMGGRLMRITSKDIDSKSINIEKHEL